MNFNQEPATLPDGSTLGPVSFDIRGERPAAVASGGGRR
jgi:hypothetical protein